MYRLLIYLILFLFSQTLLAQQSRISEYYNAQQDSFLVATSFYSLQEYDKAISVLNVLTKQDREESAFPYLLAKCYWAKNDKAQAIENASRARELDSTNVWYNLLEAQFLEDAGRTAEAIHRYEIIVKDYPRVEDYWIKLSKLYLSDGQIDKTVDVYNRMIGIFGENDELLMRKAQLLASNGRLKEAIETQEKLVDSDPLDLQFKNTLAALVKQSGDTATANKLYKEILKIDPNDSRANIALAESLKHNNKGSEFLSAIQPIISNSGVSIDLKISEIVPYLQKYMSKRDSALGAALVQVGSDLVKAHPADPKAFAINGDILFHTGHYKDALVQYDLSIKYTKKVYSIMDQKMLILLYLKRYAELSDFAEQVMDFYPNQVGPYFYKGYALLKQGKWDDAINDLSQANLMGGSRNELSPSVNALLAVAYFKKNDKTKSIQFHDAAIKLTGAIADAKNDVAEIWSDYKLWKTDIEKLNDDALMADSSNPFYLATKSRVAFLDNRFDAALNLITRALESGGKIYPSIIGLAGDINFANKKLEIALQYWKTAKDMGVESPVLDKKLAQKNYFSE
jgi:tetratricopeptide (TPR) repeat protein